MTLTNQLVVNVENMSCTSNFPERQTDGGVIDKKDSQLKNMHRFFLVNYAHNNGNVDKKFQLSILNRS